MVCSTYAEYSLVWRINGLNVFDTSLLNDFIFYAAKIHKKCSKMCIDMSYTFSFSILILSIDVWHVFMNWWLHFCKNKTFFTHILTDEQKSLEFMSPFDLIFYIFYVNRHSMLSTSSWHVHSSSQMIYFRYQYFTN